MGEYYKEANGQKIEGLGIFDLYTESVQNAPRLIGNIVIETNLEDIGVLVGFENHGGRTSLGKSATPFGKVLSGFGNNGKDSTEGIIYKNSIGTYLHGPILPKNPGVADFLIKKALENIYQEKFTLKKLDDVLELTAKKAIAKRMSVDL
jgi:CobQ-like glutamine amidotransferase family enzyme